MTDALSRTHVIPFPNQEWVSSWTTTSTSVRSPARRAKYANQELEGYLEDQCALGVKNERQAFSFTSLSTEVARHWEGVSWAHHASVGEGRRKDQEVVDPKFVRTDDILFLGEESGPEFNSHLRAEPDQILTFQCPH